MIGPDSVSLSIPPGDGNSAYPSSGPPLALLTSLRLGIELV